MNDLMFGVANSLDSDFVDSAPTKNVAPVKLSINLMNEIFQ